MSAATPLPELIAAHAGRLRLAAATRLLRPSAAAGGDREPAWRVAALAGCHHASLQAGTPFIFGWARPQTGGPITVLTTSPVTGAGLIYPPAARGHLLQPHQAVALLSATPSWSQLHLHHDSLITADDRHSAAPLDETLLDTWTEPFTWLVYATPIPADALREHTTAAAEAERDARNRTGSPAYDIAADRAKARHRELRAAETTGAWHVHLLSGASNESAAATLTGLLAAAIDLSRHGYTITPGQSVASLDEAIAHNTKGTLTGTPLLSELCAPPRGEIPGVAVHTRSTFSVNPPPIEQGLRLGSVLDRSEHPASELLLGPDSLVRHTFVTGATGSGKTSTIQTLLSQATETGLPWLVIEPAKAEYRHRLPATVLRIGHPDTPALGINPLQPAEGFPLRTHADMLKALLVGAFHGDEPFPQIMAAAIEACYRNTGWDLALGQPAHPGIEPRWPTLTDLAAAARRTITAAGYGPEVQANVTGFVAVRLASLSTGTAATFLNTGHQLDIDRLLRTNVIVELEDIGDDTDKAVVMGTFLMRLTQQLRTRRQHGHGQLNHLTVIEEAHRLLRRPDHPGAAASAVETFAAMLAEIRAYGEGLIIADQIPAKLIPDVIKNTATKIMHRLPGRYDRDAVGAATNLTDDQSTHLVSLPPGTAAVATDGMRHPALVSIPAPQTRPTNSRGTTGLTATGDRVPTISNLARAAALARALPALAAWADLTVLAHLLGLPAPTPKTQLATWLTQQEPPLVELAIGQLVTASVHARTTAIAASHSPHAFAEHVTAELNTQRHTGGQCTDPASTWLFHPYRYNPARRALQHAIHHNATATRHPDSRTWEAHYGHTIPGATAAEQLAALDVLAAQAEAAVLDLDHLLLGEPPALAAHLGTHPDQPRWAAALATALGQLAIPGAWADTYLIDRPT